MLAIKHILFPVDFSERVQTAAPSVAALARKLGAEITLMHVMQPMVSGMGFSSAPPILNLAELERSVETRLQGALEKELAGITVHRETQLGDPAQCITQFACSEGVDLIAMPTHGYGRFRALLLGSVASKVLHDAECPVWTAAHTNEQSSDHVDCRTVLCAVDGTPKNVPLMEWAFQFAAATQAKLRLVHTIPAGESRPEPQMNQEFQEFLQNEAKETIDRQMQAAGISVPLCVMSGGIADGIREEAIRHNADLVVIGRGLLDEALGRLRTHAYAIIRNSPCPVLSV